MAFMSNFFDMIPAQNVHLRLVAVKNVYLR